MANDSLSIAAPTRPHIYGELDWFCDRWTKIDWESQTADKEAFEAFSALLGIFEPDLKTLPFLADHLNMPREVLSKSRARIALALELLQHAENIMTAEWKK